MTDRQNENSRLGRALEATRNLWSRDFAALRTAGNTAALVACGEIERTAIPRKTDVFFRHHVPLRTESVVLLAEMYRRFFQVAIAHPRQTGQNSHLWARNQLQPAVGATLKWIRDWYALACDGENEHVRRARSVEFEPKQTVSFAVPLEVPSSPATSWCAPSWLFQISSMFAGIQIMKSEHVPDTNTEERLSIAQTRLLLMGTRRAFLLQLAAALERVWNEETVVAGANPAEQANARMRAPNKRQGWEDRSKLIGAIRKILRKNCDLQGVDFCAELDRHHAPPLHDWVKNGQWRKEYTWKVAWRDPRLRRKIRRVRQEAMKSR